MRELRIYVEQVPISAQAKIWLWDQENYYTIKDGQLVANQIPRDAIRSDKEALIVGPDWLIAEFAGALTKWVQEKGGINTEQFNKGKVDRYENEVTYLRGLITNIINKP